MLNSTEKSYISHLCKFLPDRKPGKRGPKPIPKEILIEQLFRKVKYNLRWEDLDNSTVCHNYMKELQRRGYFKEFFKQITKRYTRFRQARSIVDSSAIESHRVSPRVRYSGKYHKYCLKMTVETTDTLVPIDFDLSSGTDSDSKILDKMLSRKGKVLSYEMFLDKGYEKYERRRQLRRRNCQIRMEMKKGKNKKRGPRFRFTEEQKQIRSSIEKVFSWIKSFMALRYNRLKTWALIMATFLFVLSYVAFMRIEKL